MKKEFEEKLKSVEARHEAELEKLKMDLMKAQQNTKSNYLAELENQQMLLENQKNRGAPM